MNIGHMQNLKRWKNMSYPSVRPYVRVGISWLPSLPFPASSSNAYLTYVYVGSIGSESQNIVLRGRKSVPFGVTWHSIHPDSGGISISDNHILLPNFFSVLSPPQFASSRTLRRNGSLTLFTLTLDGSSPLISSFVSTTCKNFYLVSGRSFRTFRPCPSPYNLVHRIFGVIFEFRMCVNLPSTA